MQEKEIEKISLLDLDEIVNIAKRYRLKIAVIGGYAVRAYTEGYRYTKDIDIITVKNGLDRLLSLLSQLKYRCKRTEFGLSGSKRINDQFIDLHISIDQIFDASTNKFYPITENSFKKAKRFKVNGYYEENRNLNIPVPIIALEELLLSKLLTEGRDKDITDIVSLLIDQVKRINLQTLALQSEKANLIEHLINRVSSVLIEVREGAVKKLWENMTGKRLEWKKEQEIRRFLKDFYQRLRAKRK